jgi:transposase
LVVLQNSVNGDRYRQLLQTELIPYARQRFRRNVLLQHVNAPAHRARVVQDFLQQQQIDQLPWPAYSPDCNSIEHAWDALDRAVRSRDVQPSNLDELTTALQEEWRNIGQRSINKPVESMPRRIQAVIDSREGYTKY